MAFSISFVEILQYSPFYMSVRCRFKYGWVVMGVSVCLLAQSMLIVLFKLCRTFPIYTTNLRPVLVLDGHIQFGITAVSGY